MQVLYTRFPSLSVYMAKADIYLHIHVPVYILMAPVEVLTHPLSSPFAPPHLSCFPLSFPHFLAAVLSVERVINRATRWCCNTFWKHYRVPALCAVMQESRRGPLISTTPERETCNFFIIEIAELWSRRLHVPLAWIYQG